MMGYQNFSEGKCIIQVVLTPKLVGLLNELALSRNISRSKLIRIAIEKMYFNEQFKEEIELVEEK